MVANLNKETIPPDRVTVAVDDCSSIVEVLKRRALATPNQPVFTFLHNGEAALDALTFGRLDAQAERYAYALRRAASAGDRVVLLLPAGYSFIEALFGCFYANCVPVPVAFSRKRDFQAPRRRASDDTPLVEKITCDTDATVAITTREWSQTLRNADDSTKLRASTIHHLLIEDLVGNDDMPSSRQITRLPNTHALAYLQYTSGSTGDPRGVMTSHANVMAAVRGSAAAFGIDERSRFVSWLPHYHDMGLVGSILQTIYCGAQCWLMSPHSFIAKPDRWLTAISNVGATISGGPNFAYDLCVRSAAQRAADFRLETWRCAYNGSEPVRIDTLNRFAEAFAVAGFAFESFRPCYGLAEATLQVSGGPVGRRAAVRNVSQATQAGKALERLSVSCGLPVKGADVRIVDPKSLAPVPEGIVGEIWVQARHVGGGYWRKAEASRETFQAKLADRHDDTTYLRTGDAGLLLDGELYVFGRFKDAIILNGVNHQPEPIETTVTLTGTKQRLATAAAVGVSIDGRERLVVIAKVAARSAQPSSNLVDICRELRTAIHRAHDLAVHALVLVPYLTLPRTTSGKIRRGKTKELFLSGRLNILATDEAAPGAGSSHVD